MKPGVLSCLLLCFLGVGSLAHGEEKDDSVGRYESIQQHMGARFKITIYADQATAARVIPAAFARIREIDFRLSNYKPQSELSQLTKRRDSSLPVGDDLWDILVLSQKMHRETGGAFDVTLGPITDLWRIARQKTALPGKREVEKALARTGMRHIELDEADKSVRLLRENMALDPGGIAKGWAVQEAVLVLKENGITSALVDGGGDMYMVGAPQGRDGWRILVAPLRPGGKPSTIISLKNQAVATSGDTWQYLPINGKRYSHIVDPKTGMGVTTPSSVTVIANDGASADAWASAISVLGPEKGLQRIEKHKDVEALIVYLDDEGEVRKKSSPGFERYVVKPE